MPVSSGAISLEHYVRSVFRAAGMLLLLVLLLTASVFAYLLWWVGPELEAAIDDARTVRTIHEAMLDQETSLRGFLLTGDDEALRLYDASRVAMQEASAIADESLASHGDFGSSFIALRLAQQQWVEQWAEPAAAEPTFESEADRTRFIREGRELFDEYRAAEDRLIAQLLAERDRLLDLQRNVLAVTAAAALATGAALLAITLRERRNIRELVVDPVEDLRRTMERLSTGDFTARPAHTGAVEMRQLAGSLDAMADQLHDALRMVSEQTATISERAERQGQILSMARDIAGSLNVHYVLRAVADQAHRLTAPSAVGVWLVHDAAEGERTLTEAWRHADDHSAAGAGVHELGQGLVGEVARDGRAKTADERGTPAVSTDTARPAGALAVPMIVGARVVGVIHAQLHPARPVDAEVVAMVETLAAHAGTAIEAARLHEATRELSQMDALTKLYNRRRLDADLHSELARAARDDRPLAFVMADLDHFKSFNDSFGHQRGDEVLEEVARVLTGAVRATDTVYRYGGEELSILLRETSLHEAAELADRLRETIERHFASTPGQRAVTTSMGVAARGDDVSTPEELVGAADTALYEAKAAGRNRVVVARPPRADGATAALR